jgi:4-oxalocrotonate tautomerase
LDATLRPRAQTHDGPLKRRKERYASRNRKNVAGQSEEQKERLAAKIAQDVMDILDYGEESVSVAMEEIKSSDWAKEVYQPDIKGKWDKLYKKPGYTM